MVRRGGGGERGGPTMGGGRVAGAVVAVWRAAAVFKNDERARRRM